MSVTDVTPAPIQAPLRPAPASQPARSDDYQIPGGSFDRAEEIPLKFSDVIALINPLQHLPIVGPLYRKLTGDEPHPAVKSIGGMIFGGPIGLVSATLNHVFEHTTGKSMIEAVADAIMPSGPKPAAAVVDADAAVGAPRMLIPAAAAALPEAVNKAAAALAPAPEPAPASPVPPPPPTPAQTSAIATAARQAGARDLAWYQANAGTRMPATSSSVTSSASQPTTPPRSVGPSFAQGAGVMNEAGGRRSNLSPEEFVRRAAILQDRYAALRQQMSRRDALVDRLE